MKYLKLYNESYSKNDLEEFCNDNLAFILDMGFRLSIHSFKNNIISMTCIDDKGVLLSEINNDFIPFLELLKLNYKPSSNSVRFDFITDESKKDYVYVDYYDIIDEDVKNYRLVSIEIEVKMKYLKRYNESIEISDDKLLGICEDYLVYLMDDIKDLKIRINNNPIHDYLRVVSFFRSNPNHNTFSWDVVKDDFIPLVSILNEKFNIVEVEIMTNKSTPIKVINKENKTIDHSLSVDDILKDNIIEGVDDIMVFNIKIKDVK